MGHEKDNKAGGAQIKRQIPNGFKFAFGGIAGMTAAAVVQPMDLIKTRMQLMGGRQSVVKVAKDIIAREGFLKLYAGVSAALLRQATYTTTRLGVYNTCVDYYRKHNRNHEPSAALELGMGMLAGSTGAFVGTPAEVALIRMTADGRLPPEKRRNYKNVANALARIIREEGVFKLWRGATPTIFRAMIVNAAQLTTYSQAREFFIKYIREGIPLHFCSAMSSGLVTSMASLPVDIMKTRIQNAAQSNFAVIPELIRKEGIFALWKGFLPYYARLGPHTVLTFMFLEQLNAAYLKFTA